ncbi:hypothetical protein CKM354_000959500 [Cercospora kikuchii]|uniref:Uncharacterized protein n=1 Tax=Cercospora kikuchii TaxID=84275 RepID=A0A9P3FK41_9PEZI|nr:uncharacterized protein CKM354_000959500 [Cercospora kikuchii]GIZ46469.1 hypothetical protein CKM354_000959500 [Cercospora kikuchii]
MATFASLTMPPMEEAMEMSSPAPGQQYDGDIDIVFDDYPAETVPHDDDHMSEDGDMMRPGTAATDDLMADVEHANVTSVPTIIEEEMQDSDDATQPAEEQMDDEELIDYEDDEMYVGNPAEGQPGEDVQIAEQAQSVAPVVSTVPAEESVPAPLEASVEHEPAVKEIVQVSGDVAAETVPEPQTEHTETVSTSAEDSNISQSEAVHNDFVEQADSVGQGATEADATYSVVSEPKTAETGDDAKLPQQQELEATAEEESLRQEADDPAIKPAPLLPGTIDVSGTLVPEGPPTPTDWTLHAISIQYRDHMWPLFKSRSQPDGLLKDDNLLNVSLSDLISELRGRLELKLDEDDSIAESRELVLNFEIFGLMVAESSVHASAASLNDVLSVYLKLHDNVGIPEHDAPPLLITLTTQLNFSNSIATLKHLAETGAGLPVVENEEEENEYAEEAEGTQAEVHQVQPEASTHEDVDDHFEDQDHQQLPEDHAGEGEYNQEYDYQEEEPVNDGEETEAPEYYETHEQEADEYDEAYQPSAEENLEADGAAAENAVKSRLRATDYEGAVDPESHTSSAAVSAAAAHDTTELYENPGDDDTSPPLNQDSTEIAEDAADADGLLEEAEDQGVVASDPYALEFDNEDFSYEGDERYRGSDADAQHNPDENDDQEGTVTATAAAELGHDEAEGLISTANGELHHAEEEQDFDPAFDLLDDDGNEPFDHDEESAEAVPPVQPLEHDEDDIGFDLDDDEDAPTTPTTLTPRQGKRSLDEAADEDHIDFDEPELKKARAD